jgi:NAD(P)-dependent dehydrogenase (short-subunit alcohol dehydrogenase family)
MNNQVVIVTGGARGIGYGIAECFAAQGASLVIADTSQEAAQRAATQLNEQGAQRSIGVLCDITQRAQVQALVGQTLRTFGRIDVLVNNAGICPFVDVMEMTDEVWQRTLDVDVTGAFICTQEVARHMIDRNAKDGSGGRIVFITSQAENFTNASQVDYGAANAGLRMAMRGFALALGKHGITCNAVAPGHVMTDMTKHHWSQPGPAAYINERVPAGRLGTPRDIGQAVVFLASPAAEYISGISLHVDGGYQTSCP